MRKWNQESGTKTGEPTSTKRYKNDNHLWGVIEVKKYYGEKRWLFRVK